MNDTDKRAGAARAILELLGPDSSREREAFAKGKKAGLRVADALNKLCPGTLTEEQEVGISELVDGMAEYTRYQTLVQVNYSLRIEGHRGTGSPNDEETAERLEKLSNRKMEELALTVEDHLKVDRAKRIVLGTVRRLKRLQKLGNAVG